MHLPESLRLDGKVAVVTGASKGIGEAVARELALAGARVVLSSRKQDALEAVAGQIRAQGGEAVARAAHAGKSSDLQQLVQYAEESYGGIDIIVNNAVTNPVFGPVEDTEEWAFDKIMEVNLRGPFTLGKLALPSMKKRGGGS